MFAAHSSSSKVNLRVKKKIKIKPNQPTKQTTPKYCLDMIETKEKEVERSGEEREGLAIK